MWMNSGRGGTFFENIYDWINIDDFRNYPSTKEEFLKAGLSELIFNDYLDWVSRLYGDYFVRNNSLDSRNNDLNNTRNSIWREFIDFCINNKLILEFVDDNNTRMYIQPPTELNFFRFVYQFSACANNVHICSVDEFRWSLEICLAEKREDWFLDLKYGVQIINCENKFTLCVFDTKLGNYVALTEKEKRKIADKISCDIKELEEKIAVLEKNPPDKLIWNQQQTRESYIKILEDQKKWLENRMSLEREMALVSECEYMVNDCFDDWYGDEDKYDVNYYDDDTLYIYKGFIVCKKNNHCIENATAILMDSLGKDIEINVSYCTECRKFFLDYSTYKHYREKYGAILGNIKMAKNGEYVSCDFDLADESSLHLCGYNVSQKDNLSDVQRCTIIAATIESGAMSKNDIVHLLNYFIDVNGAKKGNEVAKEKWCSDLDFVLAYNTENQKHFVISNIVPYRRNRFIVCGITHSNKIDCVDLAGLLNKRVQHISANFGLGIVKEFNSSSVTINFDNGKEVKFTSDVFEKGIVRIVLQ